MNSVWIISVCLLAGGAAGQQASPPTAGAARPQPATAGPVPLIYGTDLFHPFNDPDDHFDLATVFSMPELDVRAVLLDLGDRQKQKPGRIPVEQMFRLAGRRAPFASGLSKSLKSPRDTGEDQPALDQGAVDLLLRTLQVSDRPVTMVTVGSVRDLCAAYNRKPDLVRSKLARVYINMGNAADGSEYNVDLDVHAYAGLMRSGLPIYWCPCMPRGNPGTTFWTFRQADVLETAPPPLQSFFIYALQTVSPDEIDPQAALALNLRPWRHLVMRMSREMWSTASLIDAAGRSVYRTGNEYVAAREAPANGQRSDVYAFVPARVDVDNKGRTKATLNAKEPNMRAFRVTDVDRYPEVMRSCLRNLLRQFPLANEFRNSTP